MLFLLQLRASPPPIDDAFISFRYARNLAEGYGLVYNPGEYVEGFTNLLWTLLLAGGIELGVDPETGSFVLGAVFGSLTLLCTWLLTLSLLPRGPGAIWQGGVSAWLVLAFPGFMRWSGSGMETPLFAACVTGALVADARGRAGWCTAALTLATLTRPDGVIFAAVIYGLALLSAGFVGWKAWKQPLLYLLAVALLTLFRVVYYGSPLPNTFHAKVPGIPLSAGFDYAWTFLGQGVLLLLPPVVVAVLRHPPARPAAGCIAIALVYAVFVGGDVLGPDRFFVATLPAWAALSVCGARLAFGWHRALGAASALCVALGTCWIVWGRVPIERPLATRWAVERELERKEREFVAAHQRRLSKWLLAHEPPIRLVAAIGIGRLGYYSDLPIVDLVGLVDRTIATSELQPGIRVPGHQRSNADYLLEREPDYIVIRRKGSGLGSPLPAVLELYAHPEFERLYIWDPRARAYRRRSLR